MELKTDCKYYIGEKPCRFGRLCDGCPFFEAWGKKILLIKTSAMGDVMRTTSLLPAIERKYPGARITWLARSDSAPLLKNNPLLHEILLIDCLALPVILARQFDLILSLDKSLPECSIAALAAATEKKGVTINSHGKPVPINPEAEYYFQLGISDELKFRKNKKTYNELIREVCCLDALREPPAIFLSDQEKKIADSLLSLAGINMNEKKIGIVVGAGEAFANKTPSPDKWEVLIRRIKSSQRKFSSIQIALLGGVREKQTLADMASRFKIGISVVEPTENVRVFAAVIARMNAIICGDTLALHLATAVETPAIALFGPTCEREVDIFAKGEKIVSPIDCAPCYRSSCSIEPNCMDAIDMKHVSERILSLVKNQ